jgi:hypothetical protein
MVGIIEVLGGGSAGLGPVPSATESRAAAPHPTALAAAATQAARFNGRSEAMF